MNDQGKPTLSPESQEKARESFKTFLQQGKMCISVDTLRNALESPELGFTLSDTTIEQMMSTLDTDGNKLCDEDEFVEIVTDLISTAADALHHRTLSHWARWVLPAYAAVGPQKPQMYHRSVMCPLLRQNVEDHPDHAIHVLQRIEGLCKCPHCVSPTSDTLTLIGRTSTGKLCL